VRRTLDSLGDRLRRLGQPWELALFGGLPALTVGGLFWSELSRPNTLVDFAVFRTAADAVIHGHSPYGASALTANGAEGFVYPPFTGILFAPFSLLPSPAARALMLVVGFAAVLLALRVLRVQDWRCYGLALLFAPTVNAIALGSITPLLLLGAAAVWRYRDRPRPAGVVAAATAAAKVFAWPLAVWLVVRSRLRAAAIFVVSGVVLILGGWVVIGFAGFSSYPHLLQLLSKKEALRSYSPAALFGTTSAALSLVPALLVVAMVGAAGRGEDGDRRAFAVAMLGAIVATPVVWLHYLLLLLVPLALYRPRLSPLWLTPFVLWLTPQTVPDGTLWKVALALVVAVAVTVRVVLVPEAKPMRRLSLIELRRLPAKS
jgi:alpha-1,2-mannosyltransferase